MSARPHCRVISNFTDTNSNTHHSKYGACTLLNNMLREQRVNVADPVLSEDPEGNRRRLKEQMSIYSMQFKAAQNAFGKQRVALSGKVGGMKDDVVICLQLGIYYSKQPHQYAP